MFALEISFKDGVSQPEMVLVRRPQAIIGASEYAHVVIDDMQSLNYQIRLIQELGRNFRIKPVGLEGATELPSQLEGVYSGLTSIDIGLISMRIYALDNDLVLKENEPPDKAGVRILRQACGLGAPEFPAIVVRGADPMIISFSPTQPVFIGRSNQCIVRLDSSDISAKHARLGFESGEFWIEDLGSTNGTFVDGQQISGRIPVKPGVPIVLGRQSSIVGVTDLDYLSQATTIESAQIKRPSARRYPVLLSTSDIARPARVVVPLGGKVVVGRDPSSDMWLGAPYVSRRHCEVGLSKAGEAILTDFSTNGTSYGDGILRNGEELQLTDNPRVMNFGGDITVAICFNEEQEQEYLQSGGDSEIFVSNKDIADNLDDASDENTLGLQTRNAGTAGAAGDTLIGTNATVVFQKLIFHLGWRAKVLLALGIVGAVVILWTVVSLLVSLF